MLKKKITAVILIILCFSLAFGSFASANESIYTGRETEIQSKGDTVKVRAPFILAPVFDKASIFGGIIGFVWVNSKVTVKGYDGYFTEITVNKTKETGYMLSFCLSDNSARLLVKYANLFTGQTRNILKDYDNPEDFSWSVSEENIISLDEKTGVVKAINPGTVVVTARFNGQKTECVVSTINRWAEQETADAEKDIVLKSSPTDGSYSFYDVTTVSKGTEMIAVGDLAQGNGQIYVKVKKGDEYKYGHIKLSDFPGIDYIMTEYHYYDQGYNLRFGSASDKIYDYTSMLNDVMMENFNLKVCPYVYSYTSLADNCKIASYGSVKSNNLAKSCPKTDGHHSESCLVTTHMRDKLLEDKGWGNDVVTKAVWTGHIMDGHKPSNSESVSQTLVFTTANTVSYSSGTYTNKLSSDIRYYSLYEITHETGHQLGLDDGYCYKDFVNGTCSNKNCFTCKKLPLPNCIMAQIKSPTNSTDMFCDDCKEIINSHLKDHH